MKTWHVAIWLCLVSGAAACGTSATTPSSDDAVVSDATDDAIADAVGDGDVLANDTLAGDAPVGDTVSAKYPTCAAIVDCARAACTASNTATCTAPCLADGAASAVPAATALLACVQTRCIAGQCQGSTDANCLTDCTSLRCMPQIFTCVDDGTSGAKGCADIKPCFDTCNQQKAGNFACLQACYESISADAKAKAKPFADCVANAPGTGDPTAGCLKETVGCFLDGKTGQKGCADSMSCLSACSTAADGFACGLDCIGSMTLAAQNAYIDVAPCLGKDITATAGCEDKLIVCLAPTGTQTCAESLGCVMGCTSNGQNDPTCTFGCLHSGSAATDKLLLSKLGCQPTSDPTCTDSIVQCLAPSGSAGCPAIVNCAMGCSTGQGQPPDAKCLMACVQTGTQATATTAYQIFGCLGSPTAPGCLDTFVSCYKPSGTHNCTQTIGCTQTCYQAGGDVNSCENTCYTQASVQGFKDMETWSACQQGCNTSCKGDATCLSTCTGQQCPAAKTACQPT